LDAERSELEGKTRSLACSAFAISLLVEGIADTRPFAIVIVTGILALPKYNFKALRSKEALLPDSTNLVIEKSL
jgi:hypothetical protein